MKTLNKCYLIGSVGKEPELKSTAGGSLVANFSLATNERYKDSTGNWQDKPEWHSLVAFSKTAEVVRDYIKKGDPLHIEGRIQTRQWEKDGQKHYRTEIVVENLIMLGGRRDNAGPAQTSRSHENVQVEQEIDDSDVPF